MKGGQFEILEYEIAKAKKGDIVFLQLVKVLSDAQLTMLEKWTEDVYKETKVKMIIIDPVLQLVKLEKAK